MARKEKKVVGERQAVTSDPRFKSLHSDPRFYIPKKKSLKGDVDKRFQTAIETDERFQDEVTTDKYGRKVKRTQTRKELEKYLNLHEKNGSESDSDSDSDVESESASENEASAEPKKSKTSLSALDRARGERGSESESSDESSDEEDDESEAEELELEDRAAIPTGDETDRIAIVNMDWDNLQAADLFVSLNGFVPRGGRIKSVTIYPSQYGKEQMAKELVQGPSREFFEKNSKAKEEISDDDDSDEEDESDDGSEDEKIRKSLLKEDKGEDVNNDKLRKYQLQRLRYYYCVVETDSVVTAKNIYDNVDGTEFETTSNMFDLRYIPEGTSFDDEVPHDKCTELPKSYRPSKFTTDVLQNSKVKLTWDETPAERARVTTKAFTNKEIEEMDFQAYLASDSDDENVEDVRKKYRSLLGTSNKQDESGDDIDMEITFNPDGEQANTEAHSGDETTLEKYKRKQKERKQRRLEERKQKQEDVEASDGDEESKKAELELLMMDDDLKPQQANNKSKKKSKKSKKLEQAEEMEAGFDIQDPRFGALLSNPEFAIDPTAPQYKKTAAMDQVMKERQKRSRDMEASSGVRAKKSRPESTNTQSLIEKIKQRQRKAGK